MSAKKGGLSHFLYGTLKGKTIVNWCMSLGASVVILGALFKIQHYPGAGPMLIIGLCTEAFLFMLGALEPQHLDTDWSKVYPELAHSDEEEEENMDEFIDESSAAEEDVTEQISATTNESGDGLTQQLDKMLADAKIGPELMESLGLGLKGLADQTNKLSDITDASAATKDYVDSVRTASQNVDSLSETYASASDALVGLASENREGASFGEQLSKMSQNLSELNTTYELQLQGAKESVENSGKYFTGVDELLASLSNSVEDAKKYSEGIHQLSSNINQLNTIYGNMLGAMNPNNNG